MTIGELVDWWIGGLVDWFREASPRSLCNALYFWGELVDWWLGGLVNNWISGLVWRGFAQKSVQRTVLLK